MIETDTLLDELANLGVKLSVQDGKLQVSAPKGVFTVELQQRVRERKATLIERLQSDESGLAKIVPDPGSDGLPFPLADLQLGYYIANDPHMEFHVRPHGYTETNQVGLDVGIYTAAWNKALRRRARELCLVNPEIALETLSDWPELSFPVYDLRGLPEQEAQARMLEVRNEMMRSELPLDRWPWFDLRLSRWIDGGLEKVRIHYNHNNYFIDGFGTTQLLSEIRGYCRNPDLTLPPNTISYRDAVLGLERAERSPRGLAARDYWFSRLSDLPPPPPLPLKSGMNRRCRSRLQRREGVLDKARWDALKAACTMRGVTPSNAITTAYAWVIATWSNCDRFVISHMATRRLTELHPEMAQILGNFATLYPLLIELSAQSSFADNARRVQKQVLDDMQHPYIGGMRVLQELNRRIGGFGNAPIPFVIGSGLFIKHFRRADFSVLETSQVLLDHQFFEQEDGSYYYVWDLLEEFFPEGMIDDMWSAFSDLLHALAEQPGVWDAPPPLLVRDDDLSERSARNATSAEVPDLRLHEPLAAHAASYPESLFASCIDARLSYTECERRSGALADELTRRGVRRGGFVAIAMDRGPQLAVAAMAVLKVGAAYVPVDPKLPPDRIEFLLRDASVAVVLTRSPHVQSIRWPDGMGLIDLDAVPTLGESEASPRSRPDASDLAYMIYTSGSTGKPKGVTIDHRGATNTIADMNRRFQVGAADSILGVSAFNFDLSVYDLFGMAAAGGRVVYPDPAAALDPNHWLDLMIAEGITLWNSVPALMSLLVEAAQRRGVILPALRHVWLSGDKIPLDLPQAIRAIAPACVVTSLGGATEASIWSIFYPIGAIDPAWVTVPYGYPMDNQTWYVSDRHGRPCPRWVPGDLEIGGIGLAHGYWNDEERTARSFHHRAEDGSRRYRTGDVGRYLPGGCIEWIGRSDFQVKIQGHRIELGEIESVLQEHPSIARAVVTVDAAQTPRARLVAHLLVREGGDEAFPAVEAFLRSRLPAYMVPSVWRRVDEIKLTANGKVDRRAFQDVVLDDAAVDGGATDRRESPVGEEEAVLQSIWQDVLGREIGVTDDFFALGGQSFDAIRIFARIKERYGHGFGLSDIWEHRSVRALAAMLNAEQSLPAQARRLVAVGAGSSAGGESPLYLVHPAGGSVMAYLALGRVLSRPLYGLQAFPDDDRSSIEAIAQRYLSDLRASASEGPYTLGGWSSGGAVAYEMALRLRREGVRVDRLYLLDAPAPYAHAEMSDARLLRWFVQDLAMSLDLDALSAEPLPDGGLREHLVHARRLLGLEREHRFDVDQLLPAYACFRDMVRACAHYRPQPMDVATTVIRVNQDEVEEFAEHADRDQEHWGWGNFCAGEMRCLRVPGNHYSFLDAATVPGWVHALSVGAG